MSLELGVGRAETVNFGLEGLSDYVDVGVLGCFGSEGRFEGCYLVGEVGDFNVL